MLVTPNLEASHPKQELEMLSAQNITRITDSYASEAVRLGQFSTAEEAVAAVDADSARLEAVYSMRINMTAESLDRLFTVGAHETYWHSQQEVVEAAPIIGRSALHNGKDIHANYDGFRRTAEQGLAQFVAPEMRNTHPRYAALAGDTPSDTVRGPAVYYGNWWVRLSPALEDRAVFHFADSHAKVRKSDEGLSFSTDNVLTKKDALTAKAICDLAADYAKQAGYQFASAGLALNVDPNKLMNIDGHGLGGYVEAVVFDDIRPDDLTMIGAVIANDGEVSAAGQLIKNHPELLERIDSLQISSTTLSPLVRHWLKNKLKPDSMTEPVEDTVGTLSDEQIKEFGIDLDGDYDSVAISLRNALAKVGGQLRGNARYLRPPEVSGTYEAKDAWNRYINQLKDELAYTQGAQAANLQTFIDIQRARLFFR